MAVTYSQLAKIYSSLAKHGLRDKKEEIIEGFTGGRTKSVKAMKKAEVQALIDHLDSLDPEIKASNRMRNKIISMAHEMNWHTPGTDRIDMDRLNHWCKTKSYLKKKLDDYTHSELPKLVSQFEMVYKDYLKGV